MHLHDILAEEFKRFGTQPLSIFETGTIRGRGEASFVGDGHSTLFFGRHTAEHGGSVTTIDLHTATVKEVISGEERLVGHVFPIEGNSMRILPRLLRLNGQSFDVAFLDSDNDPQLLMHEFWIAEQLVKPGGLIMVDDVRMPHHTDMQSSQAKKGDFVWPWLRENGYTHRCHEREGWAGYRTGVLVIESWHRAP